MAIMVIDGVRHNLPADVTDEEVNALFPQEGAPEIPGVSNPGTEAPAEETSFVDTLLGKYTDTVAENRQELSDRFDVTARPGTGTHEAADDTAAVISQGVRTVGGLAVDTLSTAWQFTPDQLTDPVNTTVGQAVDYAKEIPWVQEGLTKAQEGMEAYDKWAKENPRNAEKVEATFDILSIAAPRVNPVRITPARKLNQSVLDKKVQDVGTTLEPAPNTGPGRWVEKGLNRNAEYKPTLKEVEMYQTMETVPDYNPKRTSRRNAEVTLNEVDATKAKLDEAILAQGNAPIDKEVLKTELMASLDNLTEGKGMKLIGPSEEIARRALNEAHAIIDRSDGTALGILNARREFDEIIKSVRGDAALDIDGRVTGATEASSIVRRLLNDAVADAVPDANVHDLLNRQHQMLKGWDILDSKAQKEATSAVARVLGNLRSSHLLPTTILGLGAMGGAAAGSPVLGGLVAGAGGLYIGSKLIPGGVQQSKKILGSTLQSMNKLIDKAQKSEVAKLKADRAILVDYLRSLPASDEEAQQ